MKVRKVLAIICYTVCLAAYAAAGYVSYISYRGDISYKLGFLIFLPIWIVTYWFSTFFSQLIEKKGAEGSTWLIKEAPRKVMSVIASILTFALLAFWGYVYVMEYLLSTR